MTEYICDCCNKRKSGDPAMVLKYCLKGKAKYDVMNKVFRKKFRKEVKL